MKVLKLLKFHLEETLESEHQIEIKIEDIYYKRGPNWSYGDDETMLTIYMLGLTEFMVIRVGPGKYGPGRNHSENGAMSSGMYLVKSHEHFNEWPGRGGSPYIEWAPIGSIYEPSSLEKLRKACQSWIHEEVSKHYEESNLNGK